MTSVLHEAVTDGTQRLRYLVGDDSRGFINARRTFDDQGYVEFMKQRFAAD